MPILTPDLCSALNLIAEVHLTVRGVVVNNHHHG